jgi:S1-C subfamily serine protease
MMEPMKQLSEALVATVHAFAPSTVRVEGRRRYPLSGTVWSDGVIVTTNRAVAREEGIRVGLPDGETIPASLVGRDPGTDLAVLRVEGTLPGALLQVPSWQDEEMPVGSLVLLLGRPGEGVQASYGIVSRQSGAWRTATGSRVDRFIQVDARTFPGFSGGPLLSTVGTVVGVNTAALLRGVPVTVPTATVMRVVEAILAHGRVRRGYLGIGVQPVRLPVGIRDETRQETGLLVTMVQPDGAAWRAGLLLGDVLVALDGQLLRNIDDLQAYLADDRIGEQLSARVLRGGQLQDLTVRIEESSA